jgi:hypothetical protein
MATETLRWIEAGKILVADATAKVCCPRCGEADLVVQDVQIGDRIERHLRCPKCGGYNAILLSATRSDQG